MPPRASSSRSACSHRHVAACAEPPAPRSRRLRRADPRARLPSGADRGRVPRPRSAHRSGPRALRRPRGAARRRHRAPPFGVVGAGRGPGADHGAAPPRVRRGAASDVVGEVSAASRPVRRILFGPRSVVTIHLGRRSPDGSSGLPGFVGRAVLTLLGLAPGGACRAARVAPGAGALLPHRFTLACAPVRGPGHRRSALCCALLRVTPTGRYPAPLPCGVRTFLEPVRLATPGPRPPGRLAAPDSLKRRAFPRIR